MKIVLRLAAAVCFLILLFGCAFYYNPIWFSDQQISYHLWRQNVRSSYIDVTGYRIHYFEAAPPNGSPGTPLVLIHGLGARAEDWAGMMPGLAAAGFHVYAPDLLGYGRSARPDVAYSVPLEENLVVNFMHTMHLSHADVDGWSMGGWIAAQLALDHAAMVDRLILDDSAGIKFQPPFARTAFVPTDADGLYRLIDMLTPNPPKALPAFVVRAMLRKVAAGGKIIQMSLDSMESGDNLLDDRLPHITQPTLIVWGAEDHLIPLSIGQTMHRDIPNSTLEAFTGCGHLAPSQCYKPVLAATTQFLKAPPPTQPSEQLLPGN